MKPEEIKSKANALKSEGNEAFKANRYDDALAKYEQALQVDSELHAAEFNMGRCYMKLEQLDKAVQTFQSVLNKKDDYHKARYWLIESLMTLELDDEAYEQVNRYLTHVPNNEKMLFHQYSLSNLFDVRMAFVAVDLKLTGDNQVKILEIGNGMRSGPVGLEQITGRNMEDMLAEAIQEHFQMDATVVTKPGSRIKIDPDAFTMLSEQHSAVSADFNARQLSDYRAVCCASEYQPLPKSVLTINQVQLNHMVDDKELIHEAFTIAEQTDARPRCLKFPIAYDTTIAAQIIAAMPDVNRFVLKAPDLERGKGVLIVRKAELDITLKLLLADDAQVKGLTGAFCEYYMNKHNGKLPITMAMKQIEAILERFADWRETDSSKFLVEEYATSKPVMNDAKIYDATMRVMCLLAKDISGARCEPFAYYWKLPPQPITAQCDDRDKLVSSYSASRHDALAVCDEDQQVVKAGLQAALPDVYTSLLSYDMLTQFEGLPANTLEQKDAKGLRFLHLANSFTHSADFKMASVCFSKAKQFCRDKGRVMHEEGIWHQFQGQHAEAIAKFTQALQLKPRNYASYFRRAKSYFETNETAKAQDDCRACSRTSFERDAINLIAQYTQAHQPR